MATPTKGGLIREFASGVIDRLTGRTPAAGSQNGSSAASGTEATPAQMQDGFSPATQYFPSGQPMAPVAPPGSTTGRARDYPPYINYIPNPRTEPGESAISFATLRRMASPADGGLDLLRLAIETRKDQMVAQRWQIRGREKNNDGGTRARTLEQWLRKPDGVHTYRQWLRMLLEDHFVIDAPTIYFADSTENGKPRPLFEIVDGATIKKLITATDGRTPLPPLPAYQQTLKGMVAENYTLDEMGYYAYNLLPYRLYGMSRVEQVIAHVNMAIQRALSQLDFFTEGTTPDGFVEVPENWTIEQIQQYAEWFNSILAGQSAERRRIQFVPNGANYKPTKDIILKDVFDEWLARIICFDFSLPPQALVKETNRATAETGKEAAQEEGLEPTKLWLKDVMDDCLERVGAEDLEWQWQDEEIVDPEVKAKVAQTYFGGAAGTAAKIITLAEVREFIGFPPATKEQLAELQPPEPEPDPKPDPAVENAKQKEQDDRNAKDEANAQKIAAIAEHVESLRGDLSSQLSAEIARVSNIVIAQHTTETAEVLGEVAKVTASVDALKTAAPETPEPPAPSAHELAETIEKLVGSGVPLNQALKTAGFDFTVDGGDVPLVNAKLVPLDVAATLGKEPEPEPFEKRAKDVPPPAPVVPNVNVNLTLEQKGGQAKTIKLTKSNGETLTADVTPGASTITMVKPNGETVTADITEKE